VSLTVGSLFSGIGGLDLGLEWAGIGPIRWQVERDPFCRSVLAKHWPDTERFDDVCAVGSHCLCPVDLICGGFPCQDLSYAGKGAGLAGERSGLWREYARIVRELRPRFVVVENVPALLARGLGDVLGDLAALGYDAEWHCVRASDVGAPHRRERLFVVAYPSGHEPERAREPGDVAGTSRGAQGEGDERQRVRDAAWGGGEIVADAAELRCDIAGAERSSIEPSVDDENRTIGGAKSGLGLSTARLSGWVARWPAGPGEAQHSWEAPRTIGRCDNRAARLKALGNAVVPQVAEVIGGIVMRIAAQEDR